MQVKTSDIFPIAALEGNCMIGKNGDITFIFKMDLPEVYTLSEENFDVINSELFRFFKSFKTNCVIHKQDIYLRKAFTGENFSEDSFLQKATKKYFLNRSYIDHYSFLYITLTQIESLSRNYMTSSVFRKQNQFSLDRTRIKNFENEVAVAVSFLNSSGIFSLTPCQEVEIKEIVFNYFNSFEGDCLTDIEFKPYFKVGNNFATIFSINNLENQPESIPDCIVDYNMSTEDFKYFMGFADPLGLDLDCSHVVNQVIFIDDHNYHKQKLVNRYKQFKTWSKMHPDNETGEKNLKGYIDTINDNESIILCRAHLNVMIWDRDIEKLKTHENEVKKKFKFMDVIPYQGTYSDNIYLYLGCIPGNAGTIPEEESFHSNLLQGACYFTTVSNYKSDPTGLMFNERKYNLPVTVDDWDIPYQTKLIDSRNTMIFAPTGAGKSFLLNHILRQSVETGYSITLVDLGGTGELFPYLYPEKTAYIKYQEGKPIGINPFLIRSFEELTANKIQTLAEFNFILWKKDREPLDFERVSMYKLLQHYYENHSGIFSFKTFYNHIKGHKNILSEIEIDPKFFDRDEFLHVTSEYAKGMFDFLLDDQEQSYYLSDKQVVIFDLESVQNNVDILPIMFLMIRDVNENIIWKNRGGKKRLWFEEAAKQFEYPVILRSIKYAYQTIRKYDGSIGIVLQGVEQIPDDDIGNSLITNTHIFYMLRHNDTDMIEKRLKLSQHDLYQLRSLRNNLSGERPYSEFLLRMGTGNRSNVYRLEVPPEVYYSYLSEKSDKQKIILECNRAGSMEKAIVNLINSSK
jgi:conjugation system TraG family ATPase